MFLVFSNNVSGAVLGSLSLSARSSCYFTSDEFIAVVTSCEIEFKLAE